jgi:hypothetical protein
MLDTKHPTDPTAPALPRPLNILWLDDNLLLRPTWFAPIRAHMQQVRPEVRLIELTSVAQFAQELQRRATLTHQDADYIDWIWLDVMLQAQEENENFSELGFAGVKKSDTKAGTQILDLMQNRSRKKKGAGWLDLYIDRPTTLYTSINSIGHDWAEYVEEGIRQQIDRYAVITKNFVVGTSVISINEEFQTHIQTRLAWCTEQLRQHTAVASKNGGEHA